MFNPNNFIYRLGYKSGTIFRFIFSDISRKISYLSAIIVTFSALMIITDVISGRRVEGGFFLFLVPCLIIYFITKSYIDVPQKQKVSKRKRYNIYLKWYLFLFVSFAWWFYDGEVLPDATFISFSIGCTLVSALFWVFCWINIKLVDLHFRNTW